jgi:polyphosphate kinase
MNKDGHAIDWTEHVSTHNYNQQTGKIFLATSALLGLPHIDLSGPTKEPA